MNPLRRFPRWLASVPLLVVGSVCHGHPAKIPKVVPPVQTYAVIDMTGAGINGVDRVALNDANQAAFGLTTGSGYTTYTFSNGTTTHAQDMAAQVVTSNADNTTTTENRFPEYGTNVIDSQGAIYGDINSSTVSNTPDYTNDTSTGAFMICRGGTPQWYGVPPLGDDGGTWGGSISAIGEGGFCGDAAGGIGRDGADGGFLYGPTLVVFNPALTPQDGDGNEQINSAYFIPSLMNNTGSAIGDLNHGGSWEFWDGQKFTDITEYGYLNDLNDQNQFVFQAVEGGLWEGGNVTTLRDTLPPLIQFQYWNIQPFSLSNQVKAAASSPPASPDPSANSTVHLLATAGGLDVGSYGTMLYTRNNQGKWSFANVALPAGTVIDDFVTINSSGVIAALGNGGHALLLVPVTFNVVEWNPVITPPTINYLKDLSGTITGIVIDAPTEGAASDAPNNGDIFKVAAKVQINMPDIGQLDSAAQQFELVLMQNIVLSNPGSQKTYPSQLLVETPPRVPGDDTNSSSYNDDFADENSLPRILPFNSNHEVLTSSVKDSPARPFGPGLLKRFADGYGEIKMDLRNNEFITYLFAQRKSSYSSDEYYKGILSYNPICLKWVRWRASYGVSFDFGHTPPDTKFKWDFQILDQGDGCVPFPVYENKLN